MARPRLTLYSRYFSDCSARLRIALNLKGVEYEYVAVTDEMQGQKQDKGIGGQASESESASYALLNPSLSIPTLVVRREDASSAEEQDQAAKTVTIIQSLAALEYLEEAYPATATSTETRISLLPPVSDPVGRATVRSLVNIITADTHPLTTSRVSRRIHAQFPCPATDAAMLTGNREWDVHWIRRGLNLYETTIVHTAGRFSVGDHITMADVCLVPQVWTAEKMGVDVREEFPVVRRVVNAMEREERVMRAHWRRQPDTPEEMKRVTSQ